MKTKLGEVKDGSPWHSAVAAIYTPRYYALLYYNTNGERFKCYHAVWTSLKKRQDSFVHKAGKGNLESSS